MSDLEVSDVDCLQLVGGCFSKLCFVAQQTVRRQSVALTFCVPCRQRSYCFQLLLLLSAAAEGSQAVTYCQLFPVSSAAIAGSDSFSCSLSAAKLDRRQ